MNKETICKLSMEYTARVCEGDLVGSHVVYGKLVEAAQNMDNQLEGQKFKAGQALKHAEKLDERLEEKDQEIERLKEMNTHQYEKIQDMREKGEMLEGQNQALKGELSEWKEAAINKGNDLQEHKKLLEKRETEYDQLENQHNEFRRQSREANEKLAQSNKELQSEIDGWKNSSLMLEKEKEKKESEYEMLHHQHNALQIANNSLREGMEKRDKKIDELERGTFELNDYKESLLNENKKITERVKRLECDLKDRKEKEKEMFRSLHNIPLKFEKLGEHQVTEIEPVVSMRELDKERENFTILEQAIFDIDSMDKRMLNNVSSFVFQRYHFLRMKEQQGKTGEVKK